MDQSVLKPTATKREVEEGARLSLQHSFRSLVVDPFYIPFAKTLLLNSDVLSASVCDFPHGRDATQNRVNAIRELLKIGADEVDIVSKYHLLLENNSTGFKDDIKAVAKAVNGKVLKIILEVDYLTEEQIAQAVMLICEVAKEDSVKNLIIKTKTGFAPLKIQNIDALRIIKRVLESQDLYAQDISEISSGKIGIKTSGGIKTKEDALPLLEAGAHVLGTSSGDKIAL